MKNTNDDALLAVAPFFIGLACLYAVKDFGFWMFYISLGFIVLSVVLLLILLFNSDSQLKKDKTS